MSPNDDREGVGGGGGGKEAKFFAFYANVSTPEYTALFFVWQLARMGRNNTKLKIPDRHGAVLSALALFLIKTTTVRKGEESAEIKKFTGTRRHSMAS